MARLITPRQRNGLQQGKKMASSYRRGILLGFTMAEIMFLILFCLLLVMAYGTFKKVQQIQAEKAASHHLTDILSAIQEEYDIPEENLKDIAKQVRTHARRNQDRIQRLTRQHFGAGVPNKQVASSSVRATSSPLQRVRNSQNAARSSAQVLTRNSRAPIASANSNRLANRSTKVSTTSATRNSRDYRDSENALPSYLKRYRPLPTNSNQDNAESRVARTRPTRSLPQNNVKLEGFFTPSRPSLNPNPETETLPRNRFVRPPLPQNAQLANESEKVIAKRGYRPSTSSDSELSRAKPSRELPYQESNTERATPSRAQQANATNSKALAKPARPARNIENVQVAASVPNPRSRGYERVSSSTPSSVANPTRAAKAIQQSHKNKPTISKKANSYPKSSDQNRELPPTNLSQVATLANTNTEGKSNTQHSTYSEPSFQGNRAVADVDLLVAGPTPLIHTTTNSTGTPANANTTELAVSASSSNNGKNVPSPVYSSSVDQELPEIHYAQSSLKEKAQYRPANSTAFQNSKSDVTSMTENVGRPSGNAKNIPGTSLVPTDENTQRNSRKSSTSNPREIAIANNTLTNIVPSSSQNTVESKLAPLQTSSTTAIPNGNSENKLAQTSNTNSFVSSNATNPTQETILGTTKKPLKQNFKQPLDKKYVTENSLNNISNQVPTDNLAKQNNYNKNLASFNDPANARAINTTHSAQSIPDQELATNATKKPLNQKLGKRSNQQNNAENIAPSSSQNKVENTTYSTQSIPDQELATNTAKKHFDQENSPVGDLARTSTLHNNRGIQTKHNNNIGNLSAASTLPPNRKFEQRSNQPFFNQKSNGIRNVELGKRSNQQGNSIKDVALANTLSNKKGTQLENNVRNMTPNHVNVPNQETGNYLINRAGPKADLTSRFADASNPTNRPIHVATKSANIPYNTIRDNIEEKPKGLIQRFVERLKQFNQKPSVPTHSQPTARITQKPATSPSQHVPTAIAQNYQRETQSHKSTFPTDDAKYQGNTAKKNTKKEQPQTYTQTENSTQNDEKPKSGIRKFLERFVKKAPKPVPDATVLAASTSSTNTENNVTPTRQLAGFQNFVPDANVDMSSLTRKAKDVLSPSAFQKNSNDKSDVATNLPVSNNTTQGQNNISPSNGPKDVERKTKRGWLDRLLNPYPEGYQYVQPKATTQPSSSIPSTVLSESSTKTNPTKEIAVSSPDTENNGMKEEKKGFLDKLIHAIKQAGQAKASPTSQQVAQEEYNTPAEETTLSQSSPSPTEAYPATKNLVVHDNISDPSELETAESDSSIYPGLFPEKTILTTDLAQASNPWVPWDMTSANQQPFFELVKSTPQEVTIRKAINSIPLKSQIGVNPSLAAASLPFVELNQNIPMQIQRLVQQGNAKVLDGEDGHRYVLLSQSTTGETHIEKVWGPCMTRIDENGNEKAAYLFDIMAHSDGYRIRQRYNNEEIRSQLPLDKVIYNTVLSERNMRSITRDIYKWSQENQCHMYVKLHDATEQHEKERYKFARKRLQRHFYTFEPRDPYDPQDNGSLSDAPFGLGTVPTQNNASAE